MTVENANFSNYPAFSANFQDVLIVKPKKTGEYFVYNLENVEIDAIGNYSVNESYIQKGSADYINGWLYGAVQAKMKVVKQREY